MRNTFWWRCGHTPTKDRTVVKTAPSVKAHVNMSWNLMSETGNVTHKATVKWTNSWARLNIYNWTVSVDLELKSYNWNSTLYTTGKRGNGNFWHRKKTQFKMKKVNASKWTVKKQQKRRSRKTNVTSWLRNRTNVVIANKTSKQKISVIEDQVQLL